MPSKQIVEDFVAFYGLRKTDNSIIFSAQVTFYKDDLLHKLPSRIHIITLPRAMVVYIDEFFNEGYRQPEVFSTDHFYFRHKAPGILEIRGSESQADFLVSIAILD